MKALDVGPIRLTSLSLDDALRGVFGVDTLRHVHGPTTSVSDFVDDARTFFFRVKVDKVPFPIRRFFCGTQLGITTRQTLTRSSQKYTVANKLKLHFVGAEFFSLKPTFWLERDAGGVSLGGTVRHNAVLPPPLNGLAERFMVLNSRRELLHFAKCLHERGLLAAELTGTPPARPN